MSLVAGWMRALDVGDIGSIDESGRHAEAGQQILQQRACPRIRTLHADDVIAGRYAGDDARRDRSGAAAEHQAVFGTFECGDFLAQDFDGGVVAARVGGSAEFVFETFAEFVDGFEGEDGALVNWRGDGAAVGFAVFAEVVEDVTQVHCNCSPLAKAFTRCASESLSLPVQRK